MLVPRKPHISSTSDTSQFHASSKLATEPVPHQFHACYTTIPRQFHGSSMPVPRLLHGSSCHFHTNSTSVPHHASGHTPVPRLQHASPTPVPQQFRTNSTPVTHEFHATPALASRQSHAIFTGASLEISLSSEVGLTPELFPQGCSLT